MKEMNRPTSTHIYNKWHHKTRDLVDGLTARASPFDVLVAFGFHLHASCVSCSSRFSFAVWVKKIARLFVCLFLTDHAKRLLALQSVCPLLRFIFFFLAIARHQRITLDLVSQFSLVFWHCNLRSLRRCTKKKIIISLFIVLFNYIFFVSISFLLIASTFLHV